MNRRDFVKFLSVTPAVAAASRALADIKEAEKPISDLIITPEKPSEGVLVFEHLISFQLDYNNPAREFSERFFTSIEAHVYWPNAEGSLSASTDENLAPFAALQLGGLFAFTYKPLRGRIFSATNFEITASVSELITANIQGAEVMRPL